MVSSEKEEWKYNDSTKQMSFKAPPEKPENYQISARIGEEDLQFVSKSLYIKALDRAHRAEEQLEALKHAWQLFEKYLGAAQSPEKSVPSVGQSPSLDK